MAEGCVYVVEGWGSTEAAMMATSSSSSMRNSSYSMSTASIQLLLQLPWPLFNSYDEDWGSTGATMMATSSSSSTRNSSYSTTMALIRFPWEIKSHRVLLFNYYGFDPITYSITMIQLPGRRWWPRRHPRRYPAEPPSRMTTPARTLCVIPCMMHFLRILANLVIYDSG